MTYQKCVMKETKEKCMKKGRQYYEKKKKGYKKWFVINAKHVLERKKWKCGRNWYQNMSEEKSNVEDYGKNTDTICHKKTNNKREN